MIEYIRVVSKQRPAKRAFDMQVGAHLRVYVAGKITGDANYREKFARAEQALTAMGHCVLNPANLPSGMEQGDYMRICFAMIDTANVVAFLPDFKQSAGAEVEHAYCRYIDKNIRHYEDDRNKEQCAAKISADLLMPMAAPAMPDPVEEIKKAVEKELHKGLYPDFLREVKI